MRWLAAGCALFLCRTPAFASFANGQAADLVIGQQTFDGNTANNNPGPTSLNTAYGVWVSTRQGQTFVADYNNNRVLIYNTTAPVNGRAADFVLGQPDMFNNTANQGGVSAWSLNGPISVYVYETATSTQLFVADYNNHRILVWNGIPSTNTVAASFVIGQSGFAANSAGSDAVGLNNPNGMLVVGARLYLVDHSNHRVKIHNITAGDPVPTSNGPVADNVLGQSILAGCVWWGHHYNCSSYANNAHDNAFANAFWYPFDVFVSTPAGKTLVVDGQNNRVLIYNSTWPAVVASTANASLVLGQPDFQKNGCNSSGGPTAQTLCQPSGVWVSSDGVKVVVTDEENHRVLVWNSFPTVNGQAADVVVGQANMTSRSAGSGAAQLYAPMKAFYDPVSDQFFIADWNNHRVWVKNGFPGSNGLSADFVLGQTATIGSQGANRGSGSPDATTLYAPRAATAGRDSAGNNYLYVSDHYNFRVLAYSLPITQNAQPAFRVLGQPDFVTRTQNNGGTSATSLGSPGQVFFSSGSLYVSDGGNWCTGGQGNNRVLVWNSSITANQQAADRVIGQPNFTTNGCNQGGISGSTLYGWWDWPGIGVWASDTSVAVADPTNQRVLFYRPITGNGQAAAAVLGQPGFAYADANNRSVSNKVLYYPTSLASEGRNLFVTDYSNHRVLGWKLPITQNQQPADYVLGQASFTFPVGELAPGVDGCNAGGISAQSLCNPSSVWASSAPAGYRLYVGEWSNNRVLGWTSTISSMRQPADFALGQPVLTSNACNNGGSVSAQTLCNVGRQLWADDKAISVPDANNNRVLRYAPPPNATNAAAGSVLGQPTMTGNTPFSGASPFSMNSYYWSRGVASNGTRLATVDAGNHRVMIWNTLPSANGQGADLALGQASLSANGCNQGGITASSLCSPYGLHWDGRQFFVADTSNHRILVWNGWPTATGQPANYVIGQAAFNTQSCNQGSLQVGLCSPEGLYSDGHRLWVADWSNNRVVAYTLPITANQPAAILELGQPAASAWTSNGCNQGGITGSSLCNPSGVHFDGERLFVADYSNHRVLQWSARPTANGQAADIVLGQPSASANACNNGGVTAQTMCCPAVPYSDGSRLYVSDLCNHRTMIWNSPPATLQQAADGVLGRGSLTSGGCCERNANSQTYPDGGFLVGNTLWQQDNWYHRVIRYTSTATNLFSVSITSALVPSSVLQSTVPALAFKLFVSAPSSGLTWTRLTVYNNSTLPDNSLQARLYKEAGGNSALDGGDTAISAVVALSNGKANLFFSQALDATLTTYYIGVFANPASLPFGPAGFPQGSIRLYHNLNSFGFAQAGVELGGNAPVGVAYNSGFFTPVDAADYAAYGAATGAAFAAELVNTSTGIVVASLQLGTTNDFAFMTSLAVNRLGTAGDADITGLTLWSDANANGLLDSGDVNLTSSTSPFAGGVSFVSPATPLQISTNTRQYLLVADFAGTAQNTTFGINLDSTSFSLHGVDRVSPASTTPFSSAFTTLRPAVPVVQSQVATASWWNSTFTFTGNFGQQGVSYFRYVFDQSSTHAWTDAETLWTGGSSTVAATVPAQNWYFHAKAYNSADQGGGTVDLGPFWADSVLPSAGGFARYSSTGGWIAEGLFDRLTQGVTAQITARDLESGLALNFRSPANRVGFWTFNEGAGLTSVDLTGNGNTANLGGSGLWSSGYEGAGLTLAGNQVDISTPQGVSWAGGFTMLGWIRPTCAACGYQTAWASTQFRFQYHSSAGLFRFAADTTSGGGCGLTTGTNWPVNAWHHVALVMDPAGGQNRIYINGQLATSCGGAGTPVNTRLRLGLDGVSGIGGTDPFNGSQDNVAIFNAALSEGQIQAELNNTRPAFPIVYYSTNAGAAWNVVTSTLPGSGPYLGYTGATGTTLAQTLTIANLSLAQSTNAVVCGGGSPCAATNQVKFAVLDGAGGARNAGPFALLVDAFTPVAISTPAFPSSGTWANAAASFQWTGPATTTLAGLGAGAYYLLQVSKNDPAFDPANMVISISTPVLTQVSYGTYRSTYSLQDLTTYYWRVATRNGQTGNTSPWSLSSVLRTDYSSSIASGFTRVSSTGGLIGETVWDTLASGASAQITVQDVDSGLALSVGPSDMAGFWSFDEGYGSSAADGGAGGNALAFSGGASWAAGVSGSAASLTGSNRLATPGPPSGLASGAGPRSCSAWVYPTSFANGWHMLLGYGTAGTSTAFWCGLSGSGVSPAGRPAMGFYANDRVGGSALAQNQWSHVAMTWDGSAIRLYANGALVDQGPQPGGTPNTGNTLPLNVGAVPWVSGTSESFVGRLDELRFYNRALSAAEVQVLNALSAGLTHVLVSTTAGSQWTAVSSTVPSPSPYLSLTGSSGTTSAQTLAVHNLTLARSTHTALCGGGGPCAATNQLKFIVTDVAGNISSFGPYALRVDTPVDAATPTLASPANGAFTGSAQPTLSWLHPGTTVFPGIGAFYLEVSSYAAMTPLAISISTPAVYGAAAGSYVSTTTLEAGATYYWRVRARNFGGAFGPYSSSFSFRTDFAPPAAGAFRHFDSTGGAFLDYQFNDLASGVTVQVTAQDLLTGLNLGNVPDAATAALWQFEEGTGSAARNSANGGDPATFAGGAGWGAGRWGGGALFDGVNDYASAPHAANLNVSNAMTLGAWIKPSVTVSADTAFVHKGNGSFAYYLGYASGKLAFWTGNGTALSCGLNAACAPATLAAGVWTYAAGTYDGVTLRLYINGTLADSVTYTGGIGTNSDPLILGAHAGTARFFAGVLDDVRIDNYARGAAQVQADAIGASPPLAMFSNNAGWAWTLAGATYPVAAGAPYLSIGGETGTTAAQVYQLRNLSLAQSTSTFTGSLATNQVKFLLTDVAGNLMTAGPYGVLFDSSSLTVVSTPTLPVHGGYVSTSAPALIWKTPDLDSVVQYAVQVSSLANFAVLRIDITTPAVAGMALGTHTAAAVLSEDTTYYWRVQARTNLNRVGPWSSSSTFVTDFTPPSTSAFAYLNSAGLALSEGQFTDLASGVTAQLRVLDPGSGLALSGEAAGEPPVTPGTRGLWRLNENGGTAAADATGGYNGTLNSPTWVSGRFGSGVSFDSGVSHLAVGGVPTGSAWTLEAWSRFPLPVTGGGYRTLAQDSSGGQHVVVDASGLLGVYNSGFYSSGYNVGGLAGWHRLTAVGSGGATAFYIDGVFAGAAASQLTSSIAYLGNAGTSSQNWGALDEVRLLGYAQSAAEVRAHGPFFVYFSTTAGRVWNVLASTTPGGSPYVSLTGADGSRAPETLTAYNLPLAQSTNTATCGGTAAPCGASNQVRFGTADRAGNLRLSGPYAILVDTTSAVALSTPALPTGGAFIPHARPGFVWNTPNTSVLSGITGFYLEASKDPGFATLDLSVSTPNLGAIAAAYASTFTLTDGAAYYWRVRSRNSVGNFSPYSGLASLTVDVSSPAGQGFASFNAAGNPIGEAVAGDVTSGATVQATVRDMVGGLAGPGGFGVMVTTNAAQSWIDWSTWTATLSGTGETGVLSLAEFNGRLYAGTYPNAKVYSTSDGVSWSQAFSAAGEQNIRSLGVFNGKLYAGTYPSGKVYSTADGVGWTTAMSGTGASEIWSLAAFNGWLFAGTYPGATVYATTDGASWTQALSGTGEAYVMSLAAFNGRLYAGTGSNGKVYSTADGVSWSLALSGTGETEIRSLAAFNGKLYAGTASNGKVYATADGVSWAPALSGTGESHVMSLAALNGKLYAGTYPNGRVYATADGASWTPVLSGIGANQVASLSAFGGNLRAGTVTSASVLRLVPLSAGLTGAPGSTGWETLTATGLSFAPSANSGVVCGGVAPCSATNQVIFTASDRAGNVLSAGPFAVVIDTTAARAEPIPALASGLGGGSFRPEFAWTIDSAVSGIAVRGYQLDLASSLDFVGGLVASSSTANRYASFPFDLANGSTYYWRARAFSVSGGTSPYCAPRSVTIDTGLPAATGFESLDSSGAARPESVQLDLGAGVTVQLTIQDAVGGLQRDGPAPLAPIPGTVLLWRLDDSGATVADSGLRGNHGSIVGSVARVSGRYGKALRFDGSGGYASVPYNASLAVTSATLQAWVNTYAPGPGWIFGQDGSGSTNKLALYLETGGTVSGVFGDFSLGCAGPVVNDGRWHQLALTRDATGRAVYVDGVPCVTGTAVGMDPSTEPFILGRRASGPAPYYQGVIDEARVVSRALSAAEIAADYRVGAPFAIQWSTDAGASWSLTSSTVPGAAPYLAFDGAQFDQSARMLQARRLDFAASTNAVVCAGASPCGATNQVRFLFSDRAGNAGSAGPFSVLVDTAMGRPIASAPGAGSFVNSTAPAFNWSEPNAMPRHEVQVSTDGFATLVFSSNTANPSLPSPAALAHATAYSWRVRAFDAIGLASPYSPAAGFTVDVVEPSTGSFVSFSSTGVALGEGEANDLVAGATIQLALQDPVAGLPAPGEPGAPFSVQWSTTAGASFQTLTATYPATGSSPYLSVTGPAGSTALEQLQVRNLAFAASTSPATCAGAQACGATNQLRFSFRDRAGNARVAGPYAVLIDTIARQATPIPVSPSSGSFVSQSRPWLSWELPSTALDRDIRSYRVQVALDGAFQFLVIDELNILSKSFQIPAALTQGATFFWRARAQSSGGFSSPFSAATPFVVDAVGPAALSGGFSSFDSAGTAVPETGANDLLTGVTAQLRLKDEVSGLGPPSGPKPAAQTVAEWPLNEGSGTTAADISGSGNTGAIVSPQWTPGRIGAALVVNGDDSALQGPTSLPLSGGFTLEAWVRPQGTSAGSRGAIMGQGNVSDQAYLGLPNGVAGLTNDVFNAWMTDSGSGVTEAVASTAPFVAGRWYHVAATYGGGRLRLYVDGALAAERAVTSTSGSLPFMVGRHYSPGHSFRGVIDHPRVLSRELDAASIAGDYRRGAASPFYVELSTDAGWNWRRIESTVAWTSTTPYLSFTGTYGGTAIETVQARNLQLARSTTSAVGSLGTNQLRFGVYDVAGSSSLVGPYAVIVDTIAPSAVPRLERPSAGAFVRQAQPSFQWSLPAATNPADIVGYQVQVATSPSMSPLVIDESPAAPPLSSPLSLAAGTTYYWRARSRSAMGTYSPFASTSSFRVDLAGPAVSSFLTYSSSGLALAEGALNDLATGVTAQLTVSDAISGLVKPSAPRWAASTSLYWRFDEGGGASALDSSASNNTGALQGGASWQDGRVGAGVGLNGASGYVEGANVSLSGDFTLEAWVKPASTSQSGRGGILGQGSGSAQMYVGLPDPGQGAPYVGGRFNFWLTDGVSGTPAVVASTYTPVPGLWYHLAAVYQAGAMRLYVNGELQEERAFGRPFPEVPFFVGRTSLGDFFAGVVDEARVVASALSGAQIRQDWADAAGAPPRVEVSTDAGATWTAIERTYPAPGLPYLELAGAQGTTAASPLRVYNLSLVQSTSTATGIGGTNQLRFVLRDLADNQTLAGPFAVVVDSVAPNAVPQLLSPPDQSLSPSSATVLAWTLPPGIGSVKDHDVQVSLDPGFATLALSATTSSRSFAANGLAQGATFYWRARTRTTLLGLSAYSAPYSIYVDTIAPAVSQFRSYNSTGGAIAETQWSTLLSGVTAQATVQQSGTGARGLSVSTGGFFVEVSSDAGRSWRLVASTWPASPGDPYVALTGSQGTLAPQIMTVYNLALGVSTSGALGARGTNLVRFNATSVSGKPGQGTFAILVDTTPPTVPSFASVSAPAEGQIQAALAASTDPLSGLDAAPYELQLSSDGFATVLSSTGWIASSSFTFSGLPHGISYSLRARARDVLGHVSTYSAAAAFNLANKIEATATNVAPAAALQGQAVALLRLELYNVGGDTPWESLRLASSGGSDSDVQELLLYADSNANGVFDAPGSASPDVQISPPGIRFSAGVASLRPTSAQTITPSTQTFFVGARVDPLAVVGNAIGVRIENAGSFQPIFARAAGFPIQSGAPSIEPGPAVVTFTPADLTPPTIPPGTANVPLLRLLAKTDQYTAEIGSFTVRLATGPEADIATLKVFRDDGDGNFDPSRDTLISGGSDQFQGRVATVTLTGARASRTVTPTVAAFFLAADISAAAGEGDVAAFSIPSSTWVRLASATNSVSSSNFPAQTIQTTFVTQNTLFASLTQLDSAAAAVYQGEAYNFARLDLRTSVGASAVDRLILTRAGLSFDTDVAEVDAWRDQDANGVFSASLDAFLASATFSGGSATLSFAAQTVQTSTASLFLRLTVHPGAVDGNTIGFKLANNSAIRPSVSYTIVDPAPFPLATLTPTIRATVNTVSVSVLDVAPGSSLQGAKDVPLLRLALWTDRNLARVSGVRVDLTGSALDSDLRAVKVYEGPSSFVVGASTLVSSGLDGFSSGTANVFLLLPLTVTPTTSYAYLAADLAADAVVGRSFGFAVSTTASITLNSPNVVSPAGFPATSAQVGIQRFPDTVRTYGKSLAPASAPAGQADLLVERLLLTSTLVDVGVRQVRVAKAGTLTDPEVADIRLWRDADGDGALDIFSDVLVTTQPGRFVDGVATLPLAGAQALPGGATYLMLLSLSTAATVGRTVSLSLPGDSLVVDSPSSADYSNFPIQTSVLEVAKPVVTLNATGRSMAPAAAFQGQLNVPALKLELAAQAHFVEWNRIVMARLGTSSDADITNLRVFRDSNGDGLLQPTGAGADALVSLPGTHLFSGGVASIPLSTQTITASTVTYFVAVDLSAIAPAGNTVALQVGSPSGLRLVPPDVVGSAGFPLTSGYTTVSPTVAGVFVDVRDAAPPSLLQGATNQLLASLSLRTTNYAALWRSLRLTQAGTAQDTDIAGLNLWRDANDNFAFEPGTDTLLTTGGDRFIAGLATLQLINREVIGTASRRYFVTADVNLFAGAGRAFGVQIASAVHVEVESPNFAAAAGFPTALGTTTIAKLKDTLYSRIIDVAPTAANQGFETEMLRVKLWAGRDRVHVSQWKVGRAGTISDSDIAGVNLYLDLNGNDLKDALDLLVASGPLVGGQAILRFGTNETVTTSTRTYFVTYSVAASAVIGRLAGMEISNANYFTLPSPDVAAEIGGATASSLASVVDARTPSMPVVTLPARYWPHYGKVEFVWTSTVGTGGFFAAQYAIGTSPRGNDHQDWGPLDVTQPSVKAGIVVPLQTGATYYISVKVQSTSGMWSPVGTSDALLADFAAPPAPNATMTTGDSTLLLSWTVPWTGPSGVMGYLVEYRAGTSPQWKNAKTGQASPAVSALAPRAASAGAAPAGGAAPSELFTLAVSSDELVQSTTFIASPPAGTVFVRVRAVSGSGILGEPTAVTKVQLGPLPKDGLSQVSSYPNPFDSRKGSMRFNYTLSANSDVTVRIFNLFGTKIAELKASAGGAGGQAGANDFPWDGTDSNGRRVAKGMYLAVIEAGGARVTHKVGVIH